AITGKSLESLEREWRASLDMVHIEPALLNAARARFDRPALFGRRCPRIVDRLAGIAAGHLATDPEAARVSFDELLKLDPHHAGAKLGLAACALRTGDEVTSMRNYERLSQDKTLGRLEQAAALEAAGDIDLMENRLEQARAAYDRVAEVVVD